MRASKAAVPAAHLIHASLHQMRLSPPPLLTADGHDRERRRASWVELFFDLVFAGAVNQLASTLQDHPDLTTLARFAFFFVPVWWLWVQFTFYADRHESDDAAHRCVVLLAIVFSVVLAASSSRAVCGDPAGYIAAFAGLRGLQLLLYARARKSLPVTRRLYSWYLMCFGTGGALWLCSLAVGGPLRYAVWTAALAADAVGGLGMLAPSRYVPLNPGHLTERFQLFVLIVLGESVARLVSAATLRPWSVPLAAVLTAATVTLATMWWAWVRSADQRALDRPPAIARFTAVNLPIVAGIAAASAGLHIAVLAADGASAIPIGPRAALYGGVSVGLLATAVMPSGKMTKLSRAARLATSAAAMGLVFMGAIVLPAYLVPALTIVLALGLAAESRAVLKAGTPLEAASRHPVFWRPAAIPLTVRSSRRSSEPASTGAWSARSADSARS